MDAAERLHLNAEAQMAITEVARETTKQECERTKQEQERSKRSADITTQSRHGATKHLVSGVIVAGLTGAALYTPTLAWPLVALAGVTMGIANAPEFIRQMAGLIRGQGDSKAIAPARNADKSPPGGTDP